MSNSFYNPEISCHCIYLLASCCKHSGTEIIIQTYHFRKLWYCIGEIHIINRKQQKWNFGHPVLNTDSPWYHTVGVVSVDTLAWCWSGRCQPPGPGQVSPPDMSPVAPGHTVSWQPPYTQERRSPCTRAVVLSCTSSFLSPHISPCLWRLNIKDDLSN